VEKATPGSETTSEKGQKVEKAEAEVAFAPGKPKIEESVVAVPATKATITPSPAVAHPLVSPGMAARVVQKQTGKAPPPSRHSVTQ
jgi:hypothetical protein